MIKKTLLGINWLAAGVIGCAALLALFMPGDFFNAEDWAKPVVVFVMGIGLLLILNRLKGMVSNLTRRTFRYCLYFLLAVIILIQLWVAFHYIDVAYADAFWVRDQAIALAQGSHVWGEYFKTYPNNVNSALFESFFIKVLLDLGIKTPWIIFNIGRFAWIDTGLVAGLFIIRRWSHWREGSILFALSWLFSVPIYAYGVFPYNDALVMPLALDVLALGLIAINSHGWKRRVAAVLSWLLLGFGLVMKNNLIVLVIAVILISIAAAWSRSVKWSVVLKWLCGAALVISLSVISMSKIAEQNGYVKNKDLATPVTSWIAMSLNPETQGQYNSNDFYTIKAEKNAQAKKKKSTDTIKKYVSEMRADGLLVHMFQKTGVFYSHGDFDAINLVGQWIKTPKWNVVHQRSVKFWLLLMAQVWYVAILIGSCWYLVVQKRHLLGISLLSLTILGFTAFHILLWEVEPRYALPLLPILMLLAAGGWAKLPESRFNVNQRSIISWGMVIGIGISTISLFQTNAQVMGGNAGVAKQGIGTYFPTSLLSIAPKEKYSFSVDLDGAKTNQLYLRPFSNGKVTIVIKNNQKIIKKVTGKANKLINLNYKDQSTKKMSVEIINRSKQPVRYRNGFSNYSIQTGRIVRKPQMNIVWYVNRNSPKIKDVSGNLQTVKLMSNKIIVLVMTFYLGVVLLFIWIKPRVQGKHSKRFRLDN